MQHDKGAESLGLELTNMTINTLEENEKEGDGLKAVAGKEDEALPQLTIHTLEEVSAKTVVRKLAPGEKFQNWVTKKLQWFSKCKPTLFALACFCHCLCLLLFSLVDNQGS